MRLTILLTILSGMLVCHANGQNSLAVMPVTGQVLSGRDSALQLFDQAMALMQRSSYKKNTEWDSLAIEGRQRLTEASSCREAYHVINDCLEKARHPHSFVMPQRQASVYNNDTLQLKRTPAMRELMGSIKANLADDGIGYISIPWVNTGDPVLCTRIADSLQTRIGELAAKGATRWIIDLRNNTGGNCWPMLAGVGPLLGEGVCGYFVRENRKTSIRYKDGIAMHGIYAMCRTSHTLELDVSQRQQIVVLTSNRTSSAGEIVALAFRGMPQARIMGTPTAGLTTGNTTYGLMDGSMLVLTVCREADRRGIICEGSIMPDDLVKPSDKKYSDVVLDNAIMWLQSL